MEKLHLKIIQTGFGNVEYSVLTQELSLNPEYNLETLYSTIINSVSVRFCLDAHPELVFSYRRTQTSSIYFFLKGANKKEDNYITSLNTDQSENFISIFDKKMYNKLKSGLKEKEIDFKLTTNLFNVDSNIDSRF